MIKGYACKEEGGNLEPFSYSRKSRVCVPGFPLIRRRCWRFVQAIMLRRWVNNLRSQTSIKRFSMSERGRLATEQSFQLDEIVWHYRNCDAQLT